MIRKPVMFPSAGIMLEGELQSPAGKVPFPLVVVCHPHPLYGGDTDNNVVGVTFCRSSGFNIFSETLQNI